MIKNSILAGCVCLVSLAANSSLGEEPIKWHFEAYGGFSGLHVGDFPSPEYEVLLTPLPPRDHRDMGTFHWSDLSHPSMLGINQKEPLIHGQSWKAPGRYYGEKNRIQPGVTSIHGETLGKIVTGDGLGEVIGWVTHYNNPTEKVFEDARVAVNYHLRLFDPSGNELVWSGEEMSFLIDVFETYNYDQCCPDGNPTGEGPNKQGCADRFRVGVLEDLNGNGVLDKDDLRAATVFSTFDKVVGSFYHENVHYEVSLTGFWELDKDGDPILTGEGWSPEYEFTHFEVRAEVNVAGKRPAKAGTTVSADAACQQPG